MIEKAVIECVAGLSCSLRFTLTPNLPSRACHRYCTINAADIMVLLESGSACDVLRVMCGV